MSTDNQKNVLYIEDDLANRILVNKILSASDYNVSLAQDGLEGIKLASRNKPDLILLDISMAGLDGYETATSIKSTPNLSEVPIVAVTANSLPGDKEKCLVAGCDGYISKPIDVSKFADQVQSYIMGKTDALASEKKEELVEEYNVKLANRLKEKIEELEAYNKALNSELTDKNSQINQTKNILMQSEKMASLGVLAAGISHEINNPMAFISSNVSTLDHYFKNLLSIISSVDDLLQSHNELTALQSDIEQIKSDNRYTDIQEDSTELINETQDGIERVKAIVQDIKKYAHNNDQIELESFDIHQCIESSLNIVSNQIKNKATVIRNFGDFSDVLGMEPQISQVIINLLVNASHAIEKSGEIRISTIKNNDMIEVTFEDTGTGIPPEKINQLFDPFFTTKPPGEGTGLGLYISYEIIKKHGGEIGVTSTPGEGSKFVFSLPCCTH